MAGSLALTPPDDTGDDKKSAAADKAPTEAVAMPGVFELNAEEPETITLDTYALGRPAASAPIKLWAQYAYGTASDRYALNNDVERLAIANETATGEAISQRIAVGAQINFLSFERFRLGGGAILGIAKNEFSLDGNDPLGVGSLESDFGLQQIKVYGIARGKVVGIHGGYAFDLGDDQEFTEPIAALGGAQLPSNLARSDNRDAVFFGADFDYPSERFRLLGGIDYYLLNDANDNPNTVGENEMEISGGNFLNFAFGAGLRFPVFEIGAVLQLQTRFDEPTLENVGTTAGIGSHIGMVVPYLRISPPNLPASLYIKGATPDEYLEYGYPLGGANSVQPGLGFTAGLSIGFE
ncbi:MAG: hypothetical protein WBA11_08365 [Rubrivirga sp.]